MGLFYAYILRAREIVYQRINNIAIEILPLSYILIVLSVAGEFNNGPGWALYHPLSTSLKRLSSVGIGIFYMDFYSKYSIMSNTY